METPLDRERRACEALRGEWERMQQQNRERALQEEEELRELWAGIEVGDYVELTEAAHVEKGGLLLIDPVTGEVPTKQVRVKEISGRQALVIDFQPPNRFGQVITTSEWIGRERVKGVVEQGLVKRERKGGKYWEE